MTVLEHHVDIFYVTESWLESQGDEAKCNDLAPPGCSTLSFPRSPRGGGVAIVMKVFVAICVSEVKEFPFLHSDFELAHLTITLPQHRVNLFCLYRPPPNWEKKVY